CSCAARRVFLRLVSFLVPAPRSGGSCAARRA
ncbi:hypothetical protein A2U01_0112931, partial [Trifolium medium]|nr:hypothetical protein [Trifolium medium]